MKNNCKNFPRLGVRFLAWMRDSRFGFVITAERQFVGVLPRLTVTLADFRGGVHFQICK
jgi:hypothetical protein